MATPVIFSLVDTSNGRFYSRIYISPLTTPYVYSGSIVIGDSVTTITNESAPTRTVNLIPAEYSVRCIGWDNSYDTQFNILVPTSSIPINASEMLVTYQSSGSNTTASYAISASYCANGGGGSSTTSSYLSGNAVNVNTLDFASASNPTWKEGRVFYDTSSHTLCIYNDQTDVTHNVGEELYIRVVNKTGAPILNGQALTISGSQGNRPKGILAVATTGSLGAAGHLGYDIIGVATQDIADNQEGMCTIDGIVNGVNTSAWGVGDTLYVSSSAGQLTNVRPTPPLEAIKIGIALNSTNNGSILVTTQDVIHFHDICNISSSAWQNGDIWVYDSAQKVWKNTHNLTGSYYFSGSILCNDGITGSGLKVDNIVLAGFINKGGIGTYNNIIGLNAGPNNTASCDHAQHIGFNAGAQANNASYSVFIGDYAGQSAVYAEGGIFIGPFAGAAAPSASNCIFIGNGAGINDPIDSVGQLGTILIGNATVTNERQNAVALGNGVMPHFNDSINLGNGIFINSCSMGAVASDTPSATVLVGIGTNEPEDRLHVVGNIIADDPLQANHVATKHYVDSLNQFGLDFFYRSTTGSGISGYYDMKRVDTIIASASTDLIVANASASQYVYSFVSPALDITNLNPGVIQAHCHSYRAGGTLNNTWQVELYVRTAGGTETELATSFPQGFNTSLADCNVSILLTSSVAVNTTDKLVIKYKVINGTGNPTIHFVVEGSTAAGVTVPVASSNFVLIGGTASYANSASYAISASYAPSSGVDLVTVWAYNL